MRRAAAQIEAWNGVAITARASEGTVVPNLVVCERADQQIAAAHVRQRRFRVGRAQDKLIRDDAADKIRRP